MQKFLEMILVCCIIQTHPDLTQYLRSGRSSTSWILHKPDFNVQVVSRMCMYKGVPLKSRLWHTGTWSAAAFTLPAMLLPSSILPPSSPHWTFIPARKNLVWFLKMQLFQCCGISHFSDCAMAPGSTQPVAEMSNRNISCGVKASGT